MEQKIEIIEEPEQPDADREAEMVDVASLAYDGLTAYQRSGLPRSYEQQLREIAARLRNSPY